LKHLGRLTSILYRCLQNQDAADLRNQILTIKGKLPCSLVLEKAKEIEATDHHLNEQESENKLHDGISFNRLDPSKQLATNRNSQFKPKRFPNQKQHP